MTNQKTDQIFERQEYYQSLMDKSRIESSSLDTGRPEGEKAFDIEKLGQRIKTLKSIMEDITEKSKNLEKKFRLEEKYYRTLNERMNNFRHAGGEVWKECGVL
jgi:ppGpp synthetase/RelA/SpoT-type nucleotidyltranferase